ncbi:TonB-dependent siderophore receptor [Sphingomonas sp. NCPPB 2930]
MKPCASRSRHFLPLAALIGPVALQALPAAADTVQIAQAAAPAAPSATLKPVTVTASDSAPGATEGSGSYTTPSTSTATKLDLSIRETPQTITVVTRQQIDDLKLQSVNDLLSTATGATVQRVETERTYFTVRGFDVSNFQIDGLGLPFSTEEQIGDLDTAAYDHVEVLKGANGLTSGSGNPAATVNFVRKRPTRQFQASASVGVGSWGRRRLDADISAPLDADGSVRGRFVAAAQDGDSYLDRYGLRKSLFSGIVEADLGAGTLTLGLSQQYNQPKSPMWGALPLYFRDGTPTDYPRSQSSGPNWATWDTKDRQAFAELATNWGGGWKSKATLSYRDLGSDARQLVLVGVPDAVTGAGMTTYASRYFRTERQLSADWNAKGPFTLGGRRHELMVGVSGARSRNDMFSYDDAIGTPIPSAVAFDGSFPQPAFDKGLTGQANFVNHHRSLYTAAHFNPMDGLKLIAGANLTRITSTGAQYGEAHDYRKSKVLPYAGAVYDLDSQHSVYASYTGIFNPQYKIDQARQVLDPIEGRSAEVGAKGEWLDGRLNGSVALFEAHQKNTADYAGFANGYSYYRGIDATSRGVEANLAGEVAPGLQLNAGVTHLFSLEDAGGKAVRTFVPRDTVHVGGAYRVAAVPGLTVGGNLTWQSRIFRDQGTTAAGAPIVTRQGAYAVTSVLTRYAIDKHLSVALNIHNLFDRRHLASLYWAQSYYGAPRSAQVSLNWTY